MTRPGFLTVLVIFSFSSVLLGVEKSVPEENVRRAFRWLLKNQPLSQDDQKELAFTLIEDFEEVSELLRQVREARVGTASDQAAAVLSSLQQARSQAEIHGATFGWYLFLEGQKIQTLPLVMEIKKGSPAAKAGLLPGDVIDQCQGRKLKSESSRNQLLLLLSRWPESQPIELEIRRSQVAEASDHRSKSQKKTVTLEFE